MSVHYKLFQITPEGLWLSDVFEGEPHHVRQAIIAGFLGGQPRWATTQGGVFLYGLDAHGKEIAAPPMGWQAHVRIGASQDDVLEDAGTEQARRDEKSLKPKAFTPGLYVLDRDVQNPKVDRRRNADRDWTARKVWKAGTRFVVKVNDNGVAEFRTVTSRQSYNTLLFFPEGSRSFDDGKAIAIAEALVPYEAQTVDEVVEREGRRGWEAWALVALVKSGRLTLEDVAQALNDGYDLCDAEAETAEARDAE